MTTRLAIAALVTLLTLFGRGAVAQTIAPAQPVARDNNAPANGTGRISGRVVDAESGTAVRDTMLRLSGGGLREPRNAGTDDQGRYQFEDLAPGRYALSATKPGYMSIAYGQRRPFESGRPIELADKQKLEDIDFALPRGGVIVAHIYDEDGEPVAGVQVGVVRKNGAGTLSLVTGLNGVTDDRGETRVFGLPPGDYYVIASKPDRLSAAIAAAGADRFYVATFHPGTTSADNAQRIAVQIGKEAEVSFGLVVARLGQISGSVRRADGSPVARASVSISSGTFANGVIARPDGTFVLKDVPPGDYVLRAMSSLTPGTQAAREMGTAEVSFSGTNVNAVVVTIGKGGIIRGKVSFDSQRPANAALTRLRPSVFGAPTGTVAADGAFVIGGLFEPGFLRLSTSIPGWFLKAVRLGDKDLTDVPIAVDPGKELSGVELVLTQTRGEIIGTVVDGKGTAVVDYVAIVFPEDRAQWVVGSRFLFSARPDQQGRFRVTGMPPGKYLVAARDYIESGNERNPELLEQLRNGAAFVTLGDGDSQTVSVVVQ